MLLSYNFMQYDLFKYLRSGPILEFARYLGYELPRFCYHKALSIAGNCRMCLVELVGSLKPVASCSMPVQANQKILTDSLVVFLIRGYILQLLLANHPLDCPICDQGGVCDLQDQSLTFGVDRGRFYGYRRSVFDKNFGFFVKSVMSRCIHCTRCVRFCHEVAGTKDLGMTGRGFFSEIGFYIENSFFSEVSGNVIDLCPVGALTGKVNSFNVRSWEINSYIVTDIFDSFAVKLEVYIRGRSFYKVLPGPGVQWIGDKSRFGYDGFDYQRLVAPILKLRESFDSMFGRGSSKAGMVFGSLFKAVGWGVSFQYLFRYIVGRRYLIDGYVGKGMSLEVISFFKDLVFSFGGSNVYLEEMSIVGGVDFRAYYLLFCRFSEVLLCDVGLVVGFNIRSEMPLLAVKLRVARKVGLSFLGLIGPTAEYYLGIVKFANNLFDFLFFLEGLHSFCIKLLSNRKSFILLGESGFFNVDHGIIVSFLFWLKNFVFYFLLFGYIQVFLHALGYYEVGFCSEVFIFKQRKVSKRVLFVMGCDNLEIDLFRNNFIVYFGTHANHLTVNADLIFPLYSVFESGGSFINFEGFFVAVSKLFLRVFSFSKGFISVCFLFFAFFWVLKGYFLSIFLDNFARFGLYIKNKLVFGFSVVFVFFKVYKLFSNVVFNNFYNYFSSDPISRHSRMMSIVLIKMEKNVCSYLCGM